MKAVAIAVVCVVGNQTAWAKFEAAKRRLNYTLLNLELPVISKNEDDLYGVSYEFKADVPGTTTITGHAGGVITIIFTIAVLA